MPQPAAEQPVHLAQELCGVVLGEEWQRLNLTSVPVDLIWNGEIMDRGVTGRSGSRRHPDLPASGAPHTRASVAGAVHAAFELIEDRGADYGDLDHPLEGLAWLAN